MNKLIMYYKLDENKNVIQSSFDEWSTLIEGIYPTNYRRVDDDKVNGKIISTIFIGLYFESVFESDEENCPPQVFETVVFDENKKGIYQKKYSTWKEAEEGHKDTIQSVIDETIK